MIDLKSINHSLTIQKTTKIRKPNRTGVKIHSETHINTKMIPNLIERSQEIGLHLKKLIQMKVSAFQISNQMSGLLFPLSFVFIFICGTDIGKIELKKQIKMRHHIFVSGIPNMGRSENLRSIFQKICDEIGVAIRSKDVVHIERMDAAKYGVIVELESWKVKRLIMKRACNRYLSCRQFIKTSECPDLSVQIVDYLTRHFLTMIRCANWAIRNNLIASVNITSQGVLIKRDAGHAGRYFLLLDELKEYIHRLEEREDQRD